MANKINKNTLNTLVKIKKLEHSEIEITGEIPAELFDKNRIQAFKNLSKNVELPGFRKGHIPENILTTHLSEKVILEEMAEITIGAEYRNIITENSLEPLGRPEINITKMAPGNPLAFIMKVVVLPEIILTNYKKIAKEIYAKKWQKEIEVTDKEVEDAILEIRKRNATQRKHTKESEASLQKDNGKQEKEGDLKKEVSEKKSDETDLPKFDDAFVKQFGDFKDVADFTDALKQNILFEKQQRESDKIRLEMLEKIISSSQIDLPRVIIEAELDKMMAQIKIDIERMGIKFDEYIKHLKKTEEDIRKDAEKDAEKRAKIQLILNKISIEEKIIAPEKVVEEQTEMLLKQYPEAEEERVKVYVETLITNQKVFEFLETQ
ncbi:hypothetical protein KKH46_00455 [Patescibacteria group bacterium]|nr:hypothetical protein [Patescibacteria group bacterium]MBU2010463.1 hypothetical protein [Patescibacteria group bacterium]MBU2460639.1 hypothetical protein [Patescibacteria group bacterium]